MWCDGVGGEVVDAQQLARETWALNKDEADAVKKRVDTLSATLKKRRQQRANVREVFASAAQVCCGVRPKTYAIKNWRRFSESKIGIYFRNPCHAKMTPKIDLDFWLRFLNPIRTCSILRSILGSTWSTETVVIGLSLSFCVACL